MSKVYTIKVYSPANVFLGVLPDTVGYTFSSVINGGVGDLILSLPFKSDEYDRTLIAPFNRVKIYVQDVDGEAVIYDGYMKAINTSLSESTDSVVVTAYGYATKLAKAIDWNGTSLKMDRNSTELTDMVKDVVTKYRSNYNNTEFNYTGASTQNTGVIKTYQSSKRTCAESLKKILELAPPGWHWRIGPDGVFYFLPAATTPHHYFTVGGNISAIQKTVEATTMVNEVFFDNGLQVGDTNYISNRYYSANSIAVYGKMAEAKTDGRYKDEPSVDALVDAYIDANSEPNVQLEITVKDNNYGIGYDIESIFPGQMCQILNTADPDIVGKLFQVSKVDYSPTVARLTLNDSKSLTGNEFNDIRRDLRDVIYSDGIDLVTSVNVD